MAGSYRLAGVVTTEHELELPVDHLNPDGRTITVFAREVAPDDDKKRPYLVFFQGGPGSEAPRPLPRAAPGFAERALQDYRLLLLDQRGTGRSTPVGSLPGMSPQEQAEYLTHFRADSIVRDAEAFREHLGVHRWSILGQSFGGFCVTSYLSIAPEGLREAFITGGLPALGRSIDDVYEVTYALQRERNRRYYERYPGDRDRVIALVARLEAEDIRLPDGDRLTARRLGQMGNHFGMSDGFETLHYLVELPPDSPAFLHDVAHGMGFARNPLYAVLHEAGWADGGATRWAAQRLLPDDFRERPELLPGEHVFRSVFEDVGALAPWREAAELLAEHDWPCLYDEDALAANEVPTAAIVYAEDPYVPRVFSEETARRIPRLRTWITSEYEHNGLRADGDRILGRLIDMTRGRA
jgi:pimeloyl-ACP methyl ester carboxylesterase